MWSTHHSIKNKNMEQTTEAPHLKHMVCPMPATQSAILPSHSKCNAVQPLEAVTDTREGNRIAWDRGQRDAYYSLCSCTFLISVSSAFIIFFKRKFEYKTDLIKNFSDL